MPGGAREEGGVVDGAGHVELTRQLQRLAALQGLGAGELLGAVREHGGEAVQRVGTLAGGGGGPAGEGLACGGHRRVDVVGAGEFVRVHLVAGRRVDDRVRTTGGALGEAPRDELRAVREAVLRRESFRGGIARVVHVALLRRRPAAHEVGGVAPARFDCRS